MEKKEREEMKEYLNKSVEIIESDEGITQEVKMKNGQLLAELITIIQGYYKLGIDCDKDGSDPHYELNENIDESKWE